VTAYDRSTALIVVDLQNDFADPAGSLSVSGAEALIPVINAELERATEAGATIVYTQDWHPEMTPHFERDGGTWPIHCVHDTWGAALHPSLRVVADGLRVRKGVGGEDGYSAFTVRDPVSGEARATELEARLRERGIERVVVCGLATDYCVKETALDACRLGFETTVLTDAVGAVDLAPGDGERALAEMADAGARLTRAEQTSGAAID
jgi:nicotinamidase/pyrazinamidase